SEHRRRQHLALAGGRGALALRGEHYRRRPGRRTGRRRGRRHGDRRGVARQPRRRMDAARQRPALRPGAPVPRLARPRRAQPTSASEPDGWSFRPAVSTRAPRHQPLYWPQADTRRRAMAIPHQKLTLEQFLELPDEKPALEYDHGTVTQKVAPRPRHSRLQTKLAEWFNRFAEPRQVALAFVELRTTYAGSSFVPDVSVYRW